MYAGRGHSKEQRRDETEKKQKPANKRRDPHGRGASQ